MLGTNLLVGLVGSLRVTDLSLEVSGLALNEVLWRVESIMFTQKRFRNHDIP